MSPSARSCFMSSNTRRYSASESASISPNRRQVPRSTPQLLLRVIPPSGTAVDDRKRPVVVIDPRAGQDPGIGGFKPASEIGEAFKAGHPVYFIGFTVDPLEGQTIEDVALAHTIFLQKVIDLHPRAEGKPMLIGNCQAGWHAL